MLVDCSARRATAAAAVAAVLGAMAAACSSPSPLRPGMITGDAPICYGPGPDLNLKPRITIHATPIDGGSPTSIRIATTNAHHSYRMTLAPGTYKITTYTGGVRIAVPAGKTIKAVDLPPAACL